MSKINLFTDNFSFFKKHFLLLDELTCTGNKGKKRGRTSQCDASQIQTAFAV